VSKRFERFTAKAESWTLGVVLIVLVVAYLISRIQGG
jgi:hypothetical protein